VTGVSAGLAAFGTIFYIVIYGWRDANPRDHQNPDWLVVLLRLYHRQIITYFCLLAVCLVALLLAAFIEKHAP